MNIFPSDRIEILTTLSKKEVRKILMENIRPKKGLKIEFNKPQEKELFEGNITEDRFEIQRIVTGRKSFLPKIKGHIQSNLNGSKLVLDLRVRTLVFVFMIFWLGFVGFAFIIGILGVIYQEKNPIFLILPLIMIGFGIGLLHFGYNSQKGDSINDLKGIINGELK